MSYKIAVGSSDGINVDLKFAEVSDFVIYQVEGTDFKLVEKRQVPTSGLAQKHLDAISGCSACLSFGNCNEEKNSCKKGTLDQKASFYDKDRAAQRPAGCSGNGHGCDGPTEANAKVELISDCRAVLCTKIGFQAQKQFERKAISVFDIECAISEAISKIAKYYDKVDKHESLRGSAIIN